MPLFDLTLLPISKIISRLYTFTTYAFPSSPVCEFFSLTESISNVLLVIKFLMLFEIADLVLSNSNAICLMLNHAVLSYNEILISNSISLSLYVALLN